MKTYSTTEMRNNIADVFDEIMQIDEPIVITRRKKKVAVIINRKQYREFEAYLNLNKVAERFITVKEFEKKEKQIGQESSSAWHPFLLPGDS